MVQLEVRQSGRVYGGARAHRLRGVGEDLGDAEPVRVGGRVRVFAGRTVPSRGCAGSVGTREGYSFKGTNI